VKKNRVIQFSLVIAVIILFFATYYSGDKNEIINAGKSSNSTKNANKLTEEASNIIENVSYKGNNNEGTFFELRAAIAEIRHDEPNLSRLKDVFVVIRLKNLKIIHIEADEGIFDKVSSDSNFFGNVKISDEQNNVITSDNLDFYNSKNLLQAYNKVIYTGKKGNLIADQVLVDLLKNEANIFMFEKGDKVKAKYKN
jgi:LPS export ABC transporter protein LptC